MVNGAFGAVGGGGLGRYEDAMSSRSSLGVVFVWMFMICRSELRRRMLELK